MTIAAENPLPASEGKITLAALTDFNYNPRALNEFHAHLRTKTRAYDRIIGPYFDDHQQRVGLVTEKFFLHLGRSPDFARKAGDAMRVHDIGKIKQPVDLWDMKREKDSRTPQEKLARTEHGVKGGEVIEEAAAELSIPMTPDVVGYFNLVKAVQQLHHERLNGKGPKGLKGDEIDGDLEYMMIFDSADGKFKRGKTTDQIYDELAGVGDKHVGEFTPEKVRLCQSFFKTDPAFTPPTLVF